MLCHRWYSSVLRIQLASFYFFASYCFFSPVYSAVNPNFIACAPQTCHGIPIKYPFSVPSQSSSGCGYPGFELICLNNQSLLLQTPNHNFTVMDIDYGSQTLKAAIDLKLIIGTKNCPYPNRNMTLSDIIGTIDPLPFALAKGTKTESFYYNCTTPPTGNGDSNGYVGGGGPSYDFRSHVVSYCSSPSWSSYAFSSDGDSPDKAGVTMSCQSSVSFPVLESASVNDLTTSLSSGFFLNWTISSSSACVDCAKSGGHCGSDTPNNGEFICFCEDGPHPATCSGKKKKIIIASVSTATGLLIIGMILTFCFFRYYWARKKLSPSTVFSRTLSSSKTSSQLDLESRSFQQRWGGNVTIFTYKELQEATNDFSSSNELGDGGFGAVYLGKLHAGQKVAVKRLYENNFRRVVQFMNEIEILSSIRHQNLVRLLGCTSRHSRELLLVYEYINNGTVGDHIHGLLAEKGYLTWEVRLNIAIETAEALAYLHRLDPPIIHRDVKTNNILLDNNFHVKVADFGLSRLFPLDVTHVSTAPQGTPGYVDPDYHKCYQLTDKSDVYSFGVVLAELISSLAAVDITRHRHEINLANMAINKIHNHELHEFVDSSIGFETDEWVNRTVRAVAELAFRCLATEREVRPNMDEVAESLKHIKTEHEPEKTTFSEVQSETSALPKPHGLSSPNSVTDKWASHYTTPNNSG